ncbi:hypothetical protein, partial [Novosphingobium colocasiae]|uniref:hypothetical protein n=1 Tax=Novosphingobium colocasiae TaxID=1256513 RepID=UPI0035B2E110
FNLCIQLSQAQLRQAFFMINDAATLAHDLMATARSVLVQLLWVHGLAAGQVVARTRNLNLSIVLLL